MGDRLGIHGAVDLSFCLYWSGSFLQSLFGRPFLLSSPPLAIEEHSFITSFWVNLVIWGQNDQKICQSHYKKLCISNCQYRDGAWGWKRVEWSDQSSALICPTATTSLWHSLGADEDGNMGEVRHLWVFVVNQPIFPACHFRQMVSRRIQRGSGSVDARRGQIHDKLS